MRPKQCTQLPKCMLGHQMCSSKDCASGTCLMPCLSQVTEALLRVMHLLDDLSVLTTPRMVGKVLMHQLKAPFTGLWQQGLQSPPTEPAEKLAATAAVEAPSGTS